jgi:transcriptional regulator with XRE-family HTH domain
LLNISKVEELIKEKGWKAPYFCSQLGHARNWVAEWKRGKGLPDEEMTARIAKLLDTTVEFITDQSEIKKPATGGDGRADYFMKLFKNMTPEQQDAFIKMMEASQPK